jgi:hypothetical protein
MGKTYRYNDEDEDYKKRDYRDEDEEDNGIEEFEAIKEWQENRED